MEKYKLLLKIRTLEFQIRELMKYSSESKECFEMLKDKLNELSDFILSKKNKKRWNIYNNQPRITKYAENLRNISSKALSKIEKYQAINIIKNISDSFDYTKRLSHSVQKEVIELDINKNSKVLFIGSGAMPITAFIIAKEVKAQVLCLDIDDEAIKLSKQVSKVFGISNIKFFNNSIKKMNFMKNITHIIVASLVGEKIDIIEYLRERINTHTKVILRYGNGLNTMFNQPIDINKIKNWKTTIMQDNKNICDTLVLEKKI